MENPTQNKLPNGRPASVVRIAARHTESAMATLAAVAQDENAPPAVRVDAAATILNCRLGKSPAKPVKPAVLP